MRWNSPMRFLAIALLTAVCLIPIIPSSAAALSVEDYLEIDYEGEFSQSKVHVGEDFYLMAKGKAKCIKNLSIVDKATVVGNIMARHRATGDERVLNSGYSLTIEEFPKRKGDSYEVEKIIKLRFPSGSPSGDYDIIGEVTKVTINDRDFTEFIEVIFPSYMSKTFGSVSYVAEEEVADKEEEVGEETAVSPFFVLSNFSIAPTQVCPGERISISMQVTNDGGSEGTYMLDLMINSVLEETRDVTLAPQEIQIVTFQITRDEPSSYTVVLNGLNGEFNIARPGLSGWLWQYWYYLVIVVMVVAIICLLVFLL